MMFRKGDIVTNGNLEKLFRIVDFEDQQEMAWIENTAGHQSVAYIYDLQIVNPETAKSLIGNTAEQ